jgi:hypothetical protein
MYWLRSNFIITCSEDLKLLARIYKGVSGELEGGLEVEWCDDPFEQALGVYTEGENVSTIARLVGPQTLRAVSEKKDDVILKTNCNLGSLLQRLSVCGVKVNEVINDIDKAVKSEIGRKNDLGWIHDWSRINKIQNINDILAIICLTENVDYIFQTSRGFVVANKLSVYNTWIPYNKGLGIGSVMYDKDDGFTMRDDGSQLYKELVEKHLQWKAENWKSFV